ncbi:MAG: tyrosine-type recombinase/integrase [Aminivibrio sp.]|jgi:site-specific recombinase XerD
MTSNAKKAPAAAGAFFNFNDAKDKRYTVYDTEVQGLLLRMEPSGRKTYFLNFQARTIRLRRETAKGDKLAYIPMNSTVHSTLSGWKAFMKKRDPGEYLFMGPAGEPMNDVRSSWENVLRDAEIENFRWHDVRHDFASQFLMAGVNILTVKELLTHAKLEQALRYAHLVPNQKAVAVDKLDGLY